MKRKIIFSTLAVALIMTMLYACKDSFLDKLPIGLGSEQMLANEKGVNTMLIGAYAAIDGQINGADGASWAASVTNWVWGDIASDDATKGSDISDQSTIVPVENYSVDATNGYVVNAWRFYYAGIARANAVLKELAKVNPALPDATTTSIKAQAMFIRAFIHFQAKKVYNNIPYIKETDEAIKVVNTIDAW